MTRPSRHSRAINGRVVYEARKRRSLTPARLAELTLAAGYEVDDSHLSKLELGKIRWPGPRLRDALGQVLQLTEDQMCAPCATCGGQWTAACMDHPDGEASAARPAPERSGAAA